MDFNLLEHYRHLSQDLASQYRLSSAYHHHGSKGQLREDILMTTLQDMAHDFVKLSKGEICDSTGRRSVEFDIIISYLSSAIRLFSPTTPLYSALCLSSFAMGKIGPVITPLHPRNEGQDFFNGIRPQGQDHCQDCP